MKVPFSFMFGVWLVACAPAASSNPGSAQPAGVASGAPPVSPQLASAGDPSGPPSAPLAAAPDLPRAGGPVSAVVVRDAGTASAASTSSAASASDAGSQHAAVPANTPAAAEKLRDVLLVGNSVAGTVSVIDVDSLEPLGTVNVIPDFDEVMELLLFSLEARQIAYLVVKNQQLLHHFEPQDGDRFVDDVFVSPDGKVLYVSRSNLGDVAAFDLSRPGQPRLWRNFVVGWKADHATISPDGTRLVVSDTTENAAQVFDAKTGEIVGSFPTGTYPHQNDYSHDGRWIYNSSIGNVGYNAVSYADNASAGDRWLVKVDAKTLQVVRTWNFEFGIRPSVITPDDKIMYANLSYLNGVIKFDLEAGKEIARSEQPLSKFAMDTYKSYDEFPHHSAHHGLSLSGDGQRLCDCGTIDNNVAIVRTRDMQVEQYIDVGKVPYWATTSPDGRRCFVSISGDDAVSVLDFDPPKLVKTLPVGKFPQRSRLGKIPESVIGLLRAGGA